MVADLDLAQPLHTFLHGTAVLVELRTQKSRQPDTYGIFLAALVVLIPGCVPEADLYTLENRRDRGARRDRIPEALGSSADSDTGTVFNSRL